jgi:hypothetical protein
VLIKHSPVSGVFGQIIFLQRIDFQVIQFVMILIIDIAEIFPSLGSDGFTIDLGVVFLPS